MSEELHDEITSINSIYAPTTLHAEQEQAYYILTHPLRPSISLRLHFPPDYPSTPPSILGPHSTGPDIAKGEGTYVVDIIRNVLGEVYIPGEPVMYDLIEESGSKLALLDNTNNDNSNDDGGQEVSSSQARDQEGEEEAFTNWISKHDVSKRGGGAGADGVKGGGEGAEWVVSDVVVEKKSVFVARAVGVTSVEQAKGFLGALLGSDRKVAKATHNITAWRIRGEREGVVFQDCDDDGEMAAGGRVLRLLELMGVWDVMVVVTRWYGGVQLGPDRFRIINQTAREAVVKGGFVGEGNGDKEASGKKKGKKG